MINDDTQVDHVASYLAGKKIALAVTSGIAAIETPKLARQLRRYGASVKVYMTRGASKFIGPAALEWATEDAVVQELSGRAEHICLEDAVVVAPATLNSVNKIMSGIADDAVTTLVASALGMKKPVYLAPTMHESLYQNPFLQENLIRAAAYGIRIIPPRLGEHKAKIPKLENIVARLAHDLSTDLLKGKKVMITAGNAPGKIDSVRRLSNVFKGTLGVEMAKHAYHLGADVTLLMSHSGLPLPEYVRIVKHDDYDEYRANVMNVLSEQQDIGIFSAAVADYIPVNPVEGKIPSGGVLQAIPLVQTKKVIKEVRARFPELFMVTFKYELGKSEKELLSIADARIKQGYQVVVANRGEDMLQSHKAYIVGPQGSDGWVGVPSSKQQITTMLFDEIRKQWRGKEYE
ncbi:MAG: bifunctional phosphopantothenoylcysteine decarboxylase/phosphopantothenate--cysteine ligase CoaBC [Nanoarchaeota archaeon]|nr:bifunctional phosphopantothenoylcysteine decarboxylase/phosphopantothenate--cysteine ligase CoaBC [Nanoarchaeota archaeon]